MQRYVIWCRATHGHEPMKADDGNFVLYSDASSLLTASEARVATALKTLQLIKRGLESGSIRSKPILEFDPEAESCPVRALEDIVDETLSALGDVTATKGEARE